MTLQSDFLSDMSVSRETRDRLGHYLDLLTRWNKRINLVAPDTIQHAATRHFEDSAQIFDLVKEEPGSWADLGSGGGFPGMVLAIMSFGAGWSCDFSFIESDQRKAAFLRTVSRETGVPVTVVANRIESVDPLLSASVSARALAPLPRLLPLVKRHIGEKGTAYLQKGRNYQQELQEVRDNFAFSLEIHRSRTDSEAVILEIGDIQDV